MGEKGDCSSLLKYIDNYTQHFFNKTFLFGIFRKLV